MPLLDLQGQHAVHEPFASLPLYLSSSSFFLKGSLFLLYFAITAAPRDPLLSAHSILLQRLLSVYG
jgi:hypothetical protein